MTAVAGPGGPLQEQFEDGLRLLAGALAIAADPRGAGPAISSACSALRCFLGILEAASARHCPDPGGSVERLRSQCAALLTLRQEPGDALEHTLEAVRLARDEAARVLVVLASSHD
jgi:hypothetical protein